MTALYVLHGALGSAAQLAEVTRVLGGTCIEFAGHGKTPLGDVNFTIEGFRDQLARRLDVDGADEVELFGYSMGGYVALLLAMSDTRVKRVITLGTKFEWTPEQAERDCARLDPAAISVKVPAFAADLAARHATSGGWELNLTRTASLLRALGAAPPLDLSSISAPVCVVVGDRDATVSVDESLRASRALPRGSLAVLPNTPHPIERANLAILGAIVLEH